MSQNFAQAYSRERDNLLRLVGKKAHLIHDVEFYSLEDFVDIVHGDLLNFLLDLTEKYLLHIKGCQLCKLKGFICEICR